MTSFRSVETGLRVGNRVTFSRFRLEIDAGLARLTFCRPEAGNPIDGGMCDELAEAAVVISDDAAVRAVLLSADGAVFSYGGDITSFVGDPDALPRNIKRWTMSLHSAVARLQRMDAPIVSAVQGVCAGGMAALVAGSDVVVSAPDASFTAAYAGIGFSADAGATVMLTRRMGAARARRFLLLNETLDAPASLAAGLVDEVADDHRARAEVIAARLAAGPTRAYGEIRRLINSVGDQPLETQLELEAQALARCAGTRDAREAVSAFLDRRRPTFTGA